MSYAKVSQHRTMVYDSIRNAAYEKAMRRLITPDSVVLDLGAGLGLLGLMAARAGARKVYMVEPESVVRLAPELARSAGLADRIEILQGRIEDIELPEPVDLILSVFTGNLLYSEDLLPSLFYARDRWLKPGGALLPDRAELLLTAVNAPALHAAQVAAWSAPASGFDLTAARRFAANDIVWAGRDEFLVTALSAPVVLSTCDLTTARQADCAGSADGFAQQDGICHGLRASLRIRLGDDWLDTGLDGPALHWTNPVLPLDPPIVVTAGEPLQFLLQRPAEGDWHWALQAAAGRRLQGESMARTDLPEQLRRASPEYRPRLDTRGAATRFLLEQMEGERSIATLAIGLQAAFPGQFTDADTALLFVRNVVKRFATATATATAPSGKPVA
jgi:predicted nicotinamide N-methyase